MGRSGLVMLLSFLMVSTGCVTEAPVFQAAPSSPVEVKQAGGAGLLIVECQDNKYIADIADYIIEGTVTRVESRWNEDKSAIFTYTYLLIEKYLKGTPFAGKELLIVTPGGTASGITQAVEDQPLFHEGRKVRIHFQEIDGEFHIVCAQFGVEELGLLIFPSPH